MNLARTAARLYLARRSKSVHRSQANLSKIPAPRRALPTVLARRSSQVGRPCFEFQQTMLAHGWSGPADKIHQRRCRELQSKLRRSLGLLNSIAKSFPAE